MQNIQMLYKKCVITSRQFIIKLQNVIIMQAPQFYETHEMSYHMFHVMWQQFWHKQRKDRMCFILRSLLRVEQGLSVSTILEIALLFT